MKRAFIKKWGDPKNDAMWMPDWMQLPDSAQKSQVRELLSNRNNDRPINKCKNGGACQCERAINSILLAVAHPHTQLTLEEWKNFRPCDWTRWLNGHSHQNGKRSHVKMDKIEIKQRGDQNINKTSGKGKWDVKLKIITNAEPGKWKIKY